ncbi:mitochondrial carrier family [Rhizoctonia solani]|uniref:Mitochondrial carrier family n=1 Tax=Rhizoctonia solani TaxID=456999 RepID=A0A8H7I9R8_9AGAM|nr:mitochondrial carrier family [Rhizoctonia solani]
MMKTRAIIKNHRILYAALARTTARGVGLYFARPMRLFRPTKISGWTTLRHVAASQGTSLSPAFVTNLIRTQGALVIPRHFIPPLLVNTCLGTILFTTYSYTYDTIHHEDTHLNSTIASAIAGATAGAVQSIAGAPAENVRLYLEGDTTGKQTSVQGWRQAWKDVFRDSDQSGMERDRKALRREARATRNWAREVAGMSMGRGWEGWGWSCAKDTLGFALFFATFDVSRHAATFVSRARSDRRHGAKRLEAILWDKSFHPELSTPAPLSFAIALVIIGLRHRLEYSEKLLEKKGYFTSFEALPPLPLTLSLVHIRDYKLLCVHLEGLDRGVLHL